MKNIVYRIGRGLVLLAGFSLLGCLLSASLVRFAPGFGIDERELDARLSRASVESIRASRQVNSLPMFYGKYLWSAAHGDLGVSQWLGLPISGLIKERFPVTARSVGFGVLLAWTLAVALCLASVFMGGAGVELAGTFLTSILIALPAAVVAIFAVYLRAPVFAAITVLTFPKVFRYSRNVLSQAFVQPYVLAARARGISEPQIFFRHVLRYAAPELLALLGISVSMAFGTAIPVEALCDSPGVGQLAWQAALNRDLPLMMAVTLVVTLLTVAANRLASAATDKVSR